MTPVEAIAKATLGTKWAGKLWLVGGAVRDALLHISGHPDIDIVLESSASELAQFLFQNGISKIAPVTYPRFGTALVHIAGQQVELVTARKESYDKESRKPEVEPATLYEDALRRDFTINALLKNVHSGEINDPLGQGISDLEKKILRTPIAPATTFHDDPLRILRAIRLKNRFDLTPAPGLYEAITQERERLRIISQERIRDELIKMLLHETAAQSLRELMQLGLLELFAPEFLEGLNVDQGSYHTKDVWNHTLDVVDAAAHKDEKNLLIMLGALFHDIGKPRTRTVDPEGRIRFFGHEKTGAEMTFDILLRLKFSRQTAADVACIVGNHMRLGSAIPFTLSAARRLIRDLGDLLEPLLVVCESDANALRAAPKGIDFKDVRRKIAKALEDSPKNELQSPLTGNEIMDALDLRPGPEVGRIKEWLTEAVLEGKLKAGDKDTAREMIRRPPGKT